MKRKTISEKAVSDFNLKEGEKGTRSLKRKGRDAWRERE